MIPKSFFLCFLLITSAIGFIDIFAHFTQIRTNLKKKTIKQISTKSGSIFGKIGFFKKKKRKAK